MSKISICADVTIPYDAQTKEQIYESEMNLYRIKQECEGWKGNVPVSWYVPYAAAASRIRLRIAEISRSTQPVHELGIAVKEDLEGQPESYQRGILANVKTVVETARYCGSPLNVITGCLPHGHDQTTIDVLASMDIPMCVGGNFPVNAIPLSDKAAKESGLSAADWLNVLKDAVLSGEDLVIILDTSISGNGDWLTTFKAYIKWAKANGGVFILARDM